MSNEVINPYQTFRDNTGNVLANGTVGFYINTTATLDTIFSDEALTVTQTNPYPLDAYGRIAGDVKYSGKKTLTIRTESGGFVRTIDNVSTMLSSVRTVIPHDTLAAAVADTQLVDGDAVNLKERTSGNGGGAMWDVVLSSTVTENTFNIVQCTGVATLSLVLRLDEGVDAKQWGAPGDGTDATAVFNAVKVYLASINGGECRVPAGEYALLDFVIDEQDIVFIGESSGLGYAQKDKSTILKNVSGAVFVARIPYTFGATANNAGDYSGFKNIHFKGDSEYGLFIDTGTTILEGCTVEGFQYGCALADAINNNIFKDCNFILNTKAGFVCTEHNGASFIHPNVTLSSALSNTSFFMQNCLFRQNQFGMILRSCMGVEFTTCTFESNTQHGLFIWRPSTATLRNLTFNSCWFENNYDGYTVDNDATYTITGVNALRVDASTYMAWNSATSSGFGVGIDAESRNGGGAQGITFNGGTFSANATYDKCIQVLTGFKTKFNECFIIGNNVANLIDCTSDADGTTFIDPVQNNSAIDKVQSLTDNFGAKGGSYGLYFRTQTKYNATTEPVGLYPELGSFGGPISFPALNASDPRKTDTRTLDDYDEKDDGDFTLVVRTNTTTPFSASSAAQRMTKIGRQVFLSAEYTVSVTGTVGTQDFLVVTGIPFDTQDLGQISGQCWIEATGGGATVINNGISPMHFTSVATETHSVLAVFDTMASGNTYIIHFSLAYTTDT